MPWDDELEAESGYTKRSNPDYMDTDAFFRQKPEHDHALGQRDGEFNQEWILELNGDG